jgi:hypothetical protein
LWLKFYERSEVLEANSFFRSSSQRDSSPSQCEPGQRIEQGGFTNVGQADDAALQTHENVLMNQYPDGTIDANLGLVRKGRQFGGAASNSEPLSATS